MYNCTYTQRTCDSDRHNTRSGYPLRKKHPVVSAQCILVELFWVTLLPRVKFTVNEWIRLARLWQWLSEAMKAPACCATMVPAVTTSCASILKKCRGNVFYCLLFPKLSQPINRPILGQKVLFAFLLRGVTRRYRNYLSKTVLLCTHMNSQFVLFIKDSTINRFLSKRISIIN